MNKTYLHRKSHKYLQKLHSFRTRQVILIEEVAHNAEEVKDLEATIVSFFEKHKGLKDSVCLNDDFATKLIGEFSHYMVKVSTRL